MIVLGLGSNCGNRLDFLRKAIYKLKSPQRSPRIQVCAISPIYESDALLPENAPDDWNQPFLNLNVLCNSDLHPLELLKHLKAIEEEIGRRPRGKWAPREIDIDILTIDSLVYQDENLKIPHQGLTERPFALLPLADLLPHFQIPASGSFPSIPVSSWISEWRRKPPEQIPFRTHRSHHFLAEFMGILNLTPDSFSEKGVLFNHPELAAEIGRKSLSQGTKILDIGGESTRPGADPVELQEEWRRLAPVLSLLNRTKQEIPIPFQISVDTRHPQIAREAILLGADWINDVTGFDDVRMREMAAENPVTVVIMHSLTVPPNKNAVLSNNSDPISNILEWGEKRIYELRRLGIPRERIIFDPGISFGKTIEQSWQIVREIEKFQSLGVRLLVGHSRKSFLSAVTSFPPEARDLETGVLSIELASKGVDYIRIHNPEANFRMLKTWALVNGIVQCHP